MHKLMCAAAMLSMPTLLACGSADEAEANPVTSMLVMQGGGFTSSCRDIQLNFPHGRGNSDAWLLANCRRQDGTLVYAPLNLDAHIGNNDGVPWTPGAQFSRSCPEVALGTKFNQTFLGMRCYRFNGELVWNEIVLDNCIANYNGTLNWICG